MNDALASLVSRARQWISDDPDARTAEELSGVIARGDEKDLAERMAGPLEFGTAGLRGVLGAGESRMNRAVVLRTSHGLARYVLEAAPGAAEKGVVVGYDGRHQSRVFAEDTARVLAAQGIVAYLFTHLGPTPLTAFALKELGAAAAVMVTASHNPPEYNGYKVYWSDGAQIIPPHDAGIAAKIAEAPGARAVPALDLDDARAKHLVRDVPASLVERYFAAVDGLVRDRRGRDGVRIVRAGQLDTHTPQTPGMQRAAAISAATVAARKIWAGTVTIAPDAKTGAHHHGVLESVIYVLRGVARMRWGERLEYTAEAGPGDFIYVPPWVPHQEINAGAGEALECVLVRSDQDATVVNLDITPVEQPEAVWQDGLHGALRHSR